MFTKVFCSFVLLTILSAPAFSQDWGLNDYETYDPGFYDSTTSDLYNADDDWYYDNYSIGAQEEEDQNKYDWESDQDLFGDSEIGSGGEIGDDL